MRFIISGELFSSLLHDLRNLVMIISGSTELMQRRLNKAGSDIIEPRLFETLSSSLKRTNALTSKFVEFIKMDGAAQTDLDLATILEKAIDFARSGNSRFAKVNLHTAISQSPRYVVHASQYRVFSIFLNIISNALQAFDRATIAEKNMSISLFHQNDPHTVTITITDNGPGIAPEHIDKIFEGFTTRPDGVGLGLHLTSIYISRELGGSITVKSTPFSETTFTITIPCRAKRKTHGATRLFSKKAAG
jgi:signal transduction histidine kinase